jgi:hypothetical protein
MSGTTLVMNHTPGPYSSARASGAIGTDIYGGDEARVIATVWDDAGDAHDENDEAAGNVNLFKAAPEMLAALRAALPFLQALAISTEADASDAVIHPVLEQVAAGAKAAIAKAEGGAS